MAVGHAAVGRVGEGIAGPVGVGRTAAAAAVGAGEDIRNDGPGAHHTAPAVEVKERRSSPAVAEEGAGRSPAVEDSDPAEEGHHGAHPEEGRIVVEDAEAVDSPVGSPEEGPVDSPGEGLEEVHPGDSRRALVVLYTKRVSS